jgi:hypothetical protein
MKKLAFLIAALALALPAAAQQQQQTGSNIGLGVSIVPIDGGAQNFGRTVELYMPIGIGPALRVEPSIGIATVDAPTGGTDTKDLTLGVGVFVLKRVGGSPVEMYYGGRLKLNFASWDNGPTDGSGVDLSIAGAIGSEYYLVPKFSIGLEGQLGFYSNSDASAVNVDSSGFFTTGLAFLRMYF